MAYSLGGPFAQPHMTLPLFIFAVAYMWSTLISAREFTASQRLLTRRVSCSRLMDFLLGKTCGTFGCSMAGSNPF